MMRERAYEPGDPGNPGVIHRGGLQMQDGDQPTYKVVVNHEEQYSILSLIHI